MQFYDYIKINMMYFMLLAKRFVLSTWPWFNLISLFSSWCGLQKFSGRMSYLATCGNTTLSWIHDLKTCLASEYQQRVS